MADNVTTVAPQFARCLVSRLEHAPAVRIQTNCEIQELHGEERLEAVTIGSHDGELETFPVAAVFVMIGSDPCTDWLRGAVDLDERGFVRTGVPWGDGPLSPYQTSLRGVFAVGDVRDASVKRVASAVGEGSVVVQAVHQYLAAESGAS